MRRYLPRYESVMKSCKEKRGVVLPVDLFFAFFINQKMFKTAGKYGVDSLYLTETSMQVLDGYINHIRPLLRPTCDFVSVTRNGGWQNKLGKLMTMGKYVHSTRYRQVVETASSRQLSSSAQSTISEDQKHRSVVARVHCQKHRSHEVASKAYEYLERLHGEKAILRLLKIKVVSKLTLSQMMREERSQKHHSSVSQVSRHKSGRMHL